MSQGYTWSEACKSRNAGRSELAAWEDHSSARQTVSSFCNQGFVFWHLFNRICVLSENNGWHELCSALHQASHCITCSV